MPQWWESINQYSDLHVYSDAGARLTFDQLVERVANLRGEVDGVLLASEVATAATKIPPLRCVVGCFPEANAWHTGLAMLAILSGRQVVPILEGAIMRVPDGTQQQAAHVLEQTHRLTSVASTTSGTTQQRRDEARLQVTEMLASQFALQSPAVHDVARSRILLGLDQLPGCTATKLKDIDALFQSSYGYGIEAVANAAFVTWVAATKRALINSSTFADQGQDPEALRDLITKYLNAHSIAAEEVGATAKRMPSYGRTEGFVNQFFDKYQFIRIGCPTAPIVLPAPHPYLVERISMGLVRKAFELARERAGGKTDNEFQSDFGKNAFEPYVGSLLKQYCRTSDVHAEYVLTRPRRRQRSSIPDSPDWVVFQGDDVVLIECKILRLKPGTFFGYSHDDVLADFTNPKRMPRPIIQGLKFLERAVEAKRTGKLNPATQHTTESVLAAKRKHVVGVFMQVPPVWLETTIHDALRRSLEIHSPRIEVDSMTLMGASDLEWLLSIGLGDRLAEVLWGYEQRVAGKPFMPDRGHGALLTLRDFARQVPGAKSPTPLPLLEAVYWRFANRVHQEWFGQPATGPEKVPV